MVDLPGTLARLGAGEAQPAEVAKRGDAHYALGLTYVRLESGADVRALADQLDQVLTRHRPASQARRSHLQPVSN